VKIEIVGRGKVGRALHARAQERRATLITTLHASSDRIERESGADLLVLAVPDGAIAEVAARLDADLPSAVPFVHCAGAMPAEIALSSGRPTGAMHPVVSFAQPSETLLEGRTFTLRGHPEAVRLGSELARTLGARPLWIREAGPAYHAASAITANGAVALAHLSVSMLERLDVARDDGAAAIAGLLRSVADNIETLGVPAALTGPIARGDVEVVRMHRDALDPDTRRAYDAVGKLVLRAAVDRGLEETAAAALASLLDED
jgi:predicted short-subunit dehydrogenase-like oxidoreductase (DUF2520 family)